MSTEQLPDGLQLAVNELLKLAESNRNMGPLDQGSFFDRRALTLSASADAIRAEHAQRVTLQHHAADQAQRIAELEAERDKWKQNARNVMDADLVQRAALEQERELRELRARLAEIEAQEPVAHYRASDAEWLAMGRCTTVYKDQAEDWTVPLYARPVTAQAVPDADGARFRWLCEDHGDRETREQCRSLIDRLSGMSYSAAVMSIDAAMAAAPEHKSTGCGACGDACAKRGSCRLADESPEAAR